MSINAENRPSLCEVSTKAGTKCTRPARYWVQIRAVPQPLGPNGAYGMETEPAGRSNIVCAGHVASTVDDLLTLPERYPGAVPSVQRV